MARRRVAVTGANGLVGSRLCAQLSLAGHTVIAIGRGERRLPGGFAFLSCDLTDGAKVGEVISLAAPDVVINTASMIEVDACESRPDEAYAANVEAPTHLARACAVAGGAHLVHVSTDYVFDGDNGPYSEEDVPNPRGVYATTKLAGEHAVRTLAPSWAIARTAVVFGWPQAARSNFGAWLLQALQKGQPVKLFEDQFVSPSLADNVAEMLAELALRKLPGIWNVCGADGVNRVQFARALCREFGLDEALIVPTKLADLKLASPRPLRSVLETDKVREALKAQPLSLPESLRRFHAAYRNAAAEVAQVG